MNDTLAIRNPEINYEIFISHRGYALKEAKYVHDIIEGAFGKDYAFLDNEYIVKEGNVKYWITIEKAIEKSCLFIFVLKDPTDLENHNLKYELDKFRTSQDQKNRVINILPIVIGFSPNQLPHDIRSRYNGIKYSETEQFKNDLLAYCSPRKEQEIVTFKGHDVIFIPKISENFLFDLPIDIYAFGGINRKSLIGILHNFDLDISVFEKFEEKIQNVCPFGFKRRKWLKSLINEKSDDIINYENLEKIESLGIVLEVALYYSERRLRYIVDKIKSISESILNSDFGKDSIILIDIIGSHAKKISSELIEYDLFVKALMGFSPNEYKELNLSIENRWKYIIELRDVFLNRKKSSLRQYEKKPNAFTGDPLKEIVELAKKYNLEGNPLESKFLSEISGKRLLSALQCGYKFHAPFNEVIRILKQKRISRPLIGLLTICTPTDTVDIKEITHWPIDQRKHIGLFKPGEIDENKENLLCALIDNPDFNDYKEVVIHRPKI